MGEGSNTAKDEKQVAELVEAMNEILRLRAQMRPLEEERDFGPCQSLGV